MYRYIIYIYIQIHWVVFTSFTPSLAGGLPPLFEHTKRWCLDPNKSETRRTHVDKKRNMDCVPLLKYKTNNMPLSICPYRPYMSISYILWFSVSAPHRPCSPWKQCFRQSFRPGIGTVQVPRLKMRGGLRTAVRQPGFNQVSTRFQGKSQDIPNPPKSSIVALPSGKLT